MRNNQQQNDNNSSSNDDNITCFKCGGKGHRSPECPSKKRTYSANETSTKQPDPKGKDKDPSQGRPNSNNSKGSSQSNFAQVEEAWLATSLYPVDSLIPSFFPSIDEDYALVSEDIGIPFESNSRESCKKAVINIFDSGASTHMTPHLN